MSACVENMFSVREVPWHGIGEIVQDAPTSADAIKLAGLDWEVLSNPIYDNHGNEIKGWKANTRSSDNSVLGVVTNKYQIIQNSEAFSFVDKLIEDKEIFFETAGSLNKGKRVWLLARMPTIDILGDDVDPYMCFTNTHDGTGAVKICMCDTRVVCANTLNIALSTASRCWSTKHMGDIDSKLYEARETLGLAKLYNQELANTAEKLANTTITDDRIEEILDELFPVDFEKDTQRKINNVKELKDNFMICYMMPDIAKFRGTAWGVVNAMADMADHMKPIRETSTYQENNWGRVINGHPFLDAIVKKVAA